MKECEIKINQMAHVYAIVATLRTWSQYFRSCNMTKQEKSSKIA